MKVVTTAMRMVDAQPCRPHQESFVIGSPSLFDFGGLNRIRAEDPSSCVF